MTHIFILNPYTCTPEKISDLRERLKGITNLNYHIFTVSEPGSEKMIIDWIFDIFRDEEIRLYICGETAFAHHVINSMPSFDSAQIALYPCGATNSYLQVFEHSDRVRFRQIEELVEGDVIDVDYIQTNRGICLNAFSIGSDCNVLRATKAAGILGYWIKNLPKAVGLIVGVFSSKPVRMELTIDDQKFEGDYSQVFFGNAHTHMERIFYDDHADVTDGKAVLTMLPFKGHSFQFNYMYHLSKKDIKYVDEVGVRTYGKRLHVHNKEDKPFHINLDGVLQVSESDITVQVVKKGLQLVVPRGVRA